MEALSTWDVPGATRQGAPRRRPSARLAQQRQGNPPAFLCVRPCWSDRKETLPPPPRRGPPYSFLFRGSSAGLTYRIDHGPVPWNWSTVSPLAFTKCFIPAGQ